MAVDPATQARPEIVYLLAALAIGYAEEQLPHGFDVMARRAELERVRATDPEQMRREFDQWVEAAPDEGERRVRSMQRTTYDPAFVLRSLQEELDTYDAVRAEIPVLRALVRDEDPQVRAAVAYLMAWFPEEAAGSVAVLDELLGVETVSGVTATAIVAAGLLSAGELVPLLREHLGRSDPLLRWAAAVALARLGVVERDVVAALAAACADPPEDGVGFFDGDSRAYAARTLALLGDRLPEDAVEGVLRGLQQSSESAAFPMTTTALRLTFPDGVLRPLPAFEELTELQRRAVRALADLDAATWCWADFIEIVRGWNLPATRAECRAYAGLGPEG